MPTNSPRASYDSATRQASPDSNFAAYKTLPFNGSTSPANQVHSYMFFNYGVPLGATIVSATLRMFARDGFPGTAVNLTAERVTSSWKEGTLTWNRVPSVTATHAATLSVTNPAPKSSVDIDVTTMFNDVTGGSKFFGIRLRTTTTTNAVKRFYSSEATDPKLRPQLIIVWNRAPLAPSNLSPSGGRSVSALKPVLDWNFVDRDGSAQQAYQVRVATAATVDGTGMLTAAVFDSGQFASSDTQLDPNGFTSTRTASVTTTNLSTTVTAASGTFSSADLSNTITGTGIPGGATITAYVSSTQVTISAAATASGTVTATIGSVWAGISAGQVEYWQVRAQNTSGIWSPWSDVQSFTRTVKGTVAINSPVNTGTVSDTSPVIITTASLAQEALEYTLEEANASGTYVKVWEKLRFNAAANAGATYSLTIPDGYVKRTGRNYRLTVKSWDTIDRDLTPGDPTYVTAQSVFTFTTSATPAPVTVLTATPEGNQEPGLRLDFNRASGQSAPDFFALKVDGVRVLTRIDPASVFLSGTTTLLYRFYFYGFSPREPHTFEIEAVVNNGSSVYQNSQSNATVANVTTTPAGIWLVNDDNLNLSTTQPRRIRLLGNDSPDLAIGESSTVFYPVGRKDPVRVWDTIRGWEGSVSGTVRVDDTPSDAATYLDNLEWMKSDANVTERWRVIVGREAFPATVGPLSPPPTRRAGALEYNVSLAVEQVAEFWG